MTRSAGRPSFRTSAPYAEWSVGRVRGRSRRSSSDTADDLGPRSSSSRNSVSHLSVAGQPARSASRPLRAVTTPHAKLDTATAGNFTGRPVRSTTTTASAAWPRADGFSGRSSP